MDPITAVSLASNVISFIDFTTQLLRGAKNIRAAGDFEENASLEAVTRHIDIFITKLLGPESSSLVGSDLQLSDLAAKCRALAIELLALLYKIKAKDPNSRRQAVWSVMKNMKYEEQKKSLEARLASCRDQFEMQLNFLASQENRLKLHAVLSSSQSSAHQIQEISASLDRLRDTMQVAGFSDQAKMQLSQLLRVSDDIVHAVAQERILRGLAYESARSLNERHDMIPEAHFKTFEWLVSKTADNKDKQVDFSPPPSDFSVSDASSYGSDSLVFEEEEDEGDDILAEFSKDWKQFHHSSLKADVLRSPFKCFDDSVSQIGQELRSARKLFMNWLSSGEGIFHFSAKFGAGKSTLMKFLCAHPDVQSELEAWSRTCNRRLVIGSYFFYNLGTTYQKSLAGMCRTLVYEVLELCPDLTSWILPAQWSQASSTPWQVDQTIRISDREALQAFERIIEGAATDKTQARFCFFIDGLDELEKTAEVSHGDLVNLLHDWHRRSSGHVKFCVSSREHNVFMNGFSASQRVRLHTLTRQDLELFARDKLRGIQDNATMNQIVEAILDKAQGIFFWVTLVVRNMQTRLEDGFGPDEILEQIDVLPSEVNDLFAYILDSLDTWAKSRAYRTLAILLEATRWDIEVPALGYIFLDEYVKSPTPDFGFTHPIKFNFEATKSAERWTKTRLNGICKGLVECPAASWEAGSQYGSILRFGHRSVQEFLMDTTRRSQMLAFLEGFNTSEALSHIIILSRRNAGDFDDSSFWRSDGFHELSNVLIMRQENNLDKAPWVFLHCLEEWFREGEVHVFSKSSSLASYSPNYLLRNAQVVDLPRKRTAGVGSPLFVLTLHGYVEYPLWKLRNEPAKNLSKGRISLLIACIFEFYYNHSRNLVLAGSVSAGEHDDVGVSLIRALLERDLIRPDTKVDWAIRSLMSEKNSSLNLKATLPNSDGTIRSLRVEENWSLNLIQLSFITASIFANGGSAEWIGAIIEELLQRAPNLGFSLSICNSDPLDLELRSDGEVTFRALSDSKILDNPMVDCGPRQIAHKCSFNNKVRILELLEAQTLEQKPDIQLAPVSKTTKKKWLLATKEIPLSTTICKSFTIDKSFCCQVVLVTVVLVVFCHFLSSESSSLLRVFYRLG